MSRLLQEPSSGSSRRATPRRYTREIKPRHLRPAAPATDIQILGRDPNVRRGAAALIESVADAAAAASVTPDRAISGADTEQRAACAAQASESESSSVDRECCRCSCGGERHTRQGDQRCRHRAASGLCRPSFREREQQRRSRVLPMQLRRRASHPTGRSAVQTPSSEQPVPLKLPRARAAALIESGANAEQQAARAAQASESERSSVDRERCRRSCGVERHTRQGDQRRTRRAASGLCRPSFRKREQQR